MVELHSPAPGSTERIDWRAYLRESSTLVPLDLGPIEPSRSALVLVDIQRKMVDRHIDPAMSPRHARGKNAVTLPAEQARRAWIEDVVLPNVERLLARFRALSRTVLHFAAGPQFPGAEDLPTSYRLLMKPVIDARGSAVTWSRPEYAFPESLRPIDDELVIRKRTRSGFIHTEAELLLRSLGVEDLVVVGGATEACVESTVRAAADCGFRVFVVEDAVIAETPLNQAASMIAISTFFGAVRTTDDVLADLEAPR